jgi:hypothetical protein
MKKLISLTAIFALMLAATSAMAIVYSNSPTSPGVSITNWNSPYTAMVVSDYGTNGAAISNDRDQDIFVSARSNKSNGNGWISDPNDMFYVEVSGFEGMTSEVDALLSVRIMVEGRHSESDGDGFEQWYNGTAYAAVYDGDGVYAFGPNNIVKQSASYYNSNTNDGWDTDEFNYPFDVTTVSFSIGVGIGDGSTTAYMPSGSYGTFEFVEAPETEVPEPGVCAYALTGIAALTGIKRRIRK